MRPCFWDISIEKKLVNWCYLSPSPNLNTSLHWGLLITHSCHKFVKKQLLYNVIMQIVLLISWVMMMTKWQSFSRHGVFFIFPPQKSSLLEYLKILHLWLTTHLEMTWAIFPAHTFLYLILVIICLSTL